MLYKDFDPLSEILNDHSYSRNKISPSYDCLNFPEGKFK